MNNAALNMGVQIYFPNPNFNFFDYIPGVVGLFISSVFMFLNNCHTTAFYITKISVQSFQYLHIFLVLVVKNLPANTGDIRDMGLIPGSGRSPRGGHGNPL